MANSYDTANQLEREIRESQQFIDLSAAFEQLKKDEKAYELFKEFQTLQHSLHQKMMAGEEMSEEDAKAAQEMATKVQHEDAIGQLMQKEQAFSTILDDLNRIITTPIRELYNPEA